MAALATCLLFATTVRAAETEAPPAKAKEAAPAQAAPGKNPVVQVKTSLGSFDVELYPDKAPATVKNFLAYVDSGFYDGTVFHRVINNFMIQGGGFAVGMQQQPTDAPIENEANNG
ncbi:MAG: peptidylprolyl isomerase, partial [Alphaproteobacteria bacterium]